MLSTQHVNNKTYYAKQLSDVFRLNIWCWVSEPWYINLIHSEVNFIRLTLPEARRTFVCIKKLHSVWISTSKDSSPNVCRAQSGQ
jgi:hypothetical protein